MGSTVGSATTSRRPSFAPRKSRPTTAPSQRGSFSVPEPPPGSVTARIKSARRSRANSDRERLQRGSISMLSRASTPFSRRDSVASAAMGGGEGGDDGVDFAVSLHKKLSMTR